MEEEGKGRDILIRFQSLGPPTRRDLTHVLLIRAQRAIKHTRDMIPSRSSFHAPGTRSSLRITRPDYARDGPSAFGSLAAVFVFLFGDEFLRCYLSTLV